MANEPSTEALDDFLFHNSWAFRIERHPSGLNADMGAFLMSRRILYECRGVNEGFGKWGWSDIELGLRINQKYPSAVLSHLGIYCYEMDIKKEARDQTNQERNPQVISRSFQLNSADWGLAKPGSRRLCPCRAAPARNCQKGEGDNQSRNIQGYAA